MAVHLHYLRVQSIFLPNPVRLGTVYFDVVMQSVLFAKGKN